MRIWCGYSLCGEGSLLLRPLPINALQDECSLTDRVLDRSQLAGLGLSESNWFSLLAHNNVAANRIAYFRDFATSRKLDTRESL